MPSQLRRNRRRSRRSSRPNASTAATGARLGRGVLGYLVLVVLVVTLAPLAFRVPDGIHLTYWSADSRWHGAFDVIANVALFAPLGFLYALSRNASVPDARDTVHRACVGGALLSLCIETTQLFEPARYASPTDVLTNALGALLGAWLHRKLARRLRADALLAGGLALELPVMGLVYVALPLVTLGALTADGGPRWDLAFPPRPASLVALALFGATLLGTVQRRRQASPATAAMLPRAAAAAGVAMLWFAVGALPALATSPRAFAAGLAGAAIAAAVVSTPLVARRRDERRFEGEAIGRAAPFLALALALFPFGQEVGRELTDGVLIRGLEGLCGFAVLGYLLGEAWGRRELRYRHAVGRVSAAAAAAAVVQALLPHGHPTGVALPIASVLARTLCAAYGGWIYHLQRAHVRALVESRRVYGTPVPRVPASAWVTARPRGAAPSEVHAVHPIG